MYTKHLRDQGNLTPAHCGTSKVDVPASACSTTTRCACYALCPEGSKSLAVKDRSFRGKKRKQNTEVVGVAQVENASRRRPD